MIDGDRPVNLVVLNANTSDEITAMLGARAREVARPKTRISAIKPCHGPLTVGSWQDAYRSATAMLDRMIDFIDPMDAVVMAGFGDVGCEGLCELLSVPVIDVTEAGTSVAQLIGCKYAIITPTRRMGPLIERSLALSGQLDNLTDIVPMGLTITELRADSSRAVEAFGLAAQRCLDLGAKALCIGSAALSDQSAAFAATTELAVVDPVAAAVKLAEAAALMERPDRLSASDMLAYIETEFASQTASSFLKECCQ